MNAERYADLILAALEAQQLRHAFNKKLDFITENTTPDELEARDFNNEDAQKAFEILRSKGIVFKESVKYPRHVNTVIVFCDREIDLLEDINQLGSKAMKAIITDLDNDF